MRVKGILLACGLTAEASCTAQCSRSWDAELCRTLQVRELPMKQQTVLASVMQQRPLDIGRCRSLLVLVQASCHKPAQPCLHALWTQT